MPQHAPVRRLTMHIADDAHRRRIETALHRDSRTLRGGEDRAELDPVAERAPAPVVNRAYSGADLLIGIRRQVLLDRKSVV
jgi:hypothetical protein